MRYVINISEYDKEWIKNAYKIPQDINTKIADAIINAEPLESEQQWIPCSERLPEDDRTKIVTLANGNAESGYYSDGNWWCIGDSICLENPTVIAWMPLSEPWRGDTE